VLKTVRISTLNDENQSWKAKYNNLEAIVKEKTQEIEKLVGKETNEKENITKLEKQIVAGAAKYEDLKSKAVAISRENERLVQIQQKITLEMGRVSSILLKKIEELELSKGENKNLQDFLAEKFTEIQEMSSRLVETEEKLVEVMEERALLTASLTPKAINKTKMDNSPVSKILKGKTDAESKPKFWRPVGCSPISNKNASITPTSRKSKDTTSSSKASQGFSFMADYAIKQEERLNKSGMKKNGTSSQTTLAQKIAEKTKIFKISLPKNSPKSKK